MKKLLVILLFGYWLPANCQNLKLTYPNGNEKFVVDTNEVITWEGISAQDTVILEYSIDNGINWKLITNSATGLKYTWTNITKPVSDLCLLKVRTKDSISIAPNIEWEKTYGGSSDEWAYEALETIDKGFTICGYTHSSDIDFANLIGIQNAALIHIDSKGKIIWTKKFAGDVCESMKLTSDSGYILCGYIQNNVSISGYHSQTDFWVCKTDKDGNLKWQKALGGYNTDMPYKVIQTSDGSFVVIGTSDSKDGDININKGKKDAWVVKLDSNGNILWKKTIGGSGDDYAISIIESKDNYLYITGNTNSNDKDFQNYIGGYDCFVTKLTTDGTLIWNYNYGGTFDDFGTDIIEDKKNGILILGTSNSNDLIFSKNKGANDAFVIKIDNNGQILWENIFGGTSNDYSQSIDYDSENDYIISGSSSSKEIDLSLNKGGSDFWIFKITNLGKLLWSTTLGGSKFETTREVHKTSDNSYIIAGGSTSNDGDLTQNKGSGDWWIVKLFPDKKLLLQDNSDAVFSIVVPAPPPQVLKLTRPNGAEKFLVGNNEDVTWEGISAQDTVSLEYSIDNGQNWKLLTNSATGLKYTWTNIPKPDSDKCLIKIKQNRFSKVNMDSIKTLSGHTSNVSSVDISQDGNIIVTGSNDNTAIIWDTKSNKVIHTLSGHTSWLNSVAISQDGSKIVTGSGDNTAKIWDVNTGKLIRTLIGHSDHVYGVAISVDGNKIVTGSRDKTAKIWDANTGKVINTFTGHSSCVNSVALSQDGSKIVTGSYDKTVKIWDANTGNEIRTLTGHKNLVYSVSISQDGTKIITGSYDKTAKIWDTNTGIEIRTFSGHSDYVTSVAISQDGKELITGSGDYSAKIWNLNTGLKILTLNCHKSDVNSVAISQDGTKIITGSLDKTAKIWDSKFFISEVDTSDILFSIVAPAPKGIDINMKKCLLNKSKDSIIVDCLVNNGNYKFTTDTVFISGADASAFQVINLITPFDLDFAQTKNIEFRFIPNRVSLHSAKVNIITQSDTLVYNIIGEGISNKDTAKLTFKTIRIEANTGVSIKVPIILENAISLSTSSITSLQTDLTFNSSMLFPMDYKIDSIGLNLGKITISNMPINKKSGDTLTLVRFIPSLGNAQECDLVLANPISIGGDADFTLVNGHFKLLDVCYDGGARFLNGTKQSSLFAIYPNPASDNIEIEYSNADNGLAEFKSINVLGEIVSSIKLEKTQNGKAKMNLKNLPSGQYFGVFNTESINQNMIISVIR